MWRQSFGIAAFNQKPKTKEMNREIKFRAWVAESFDENGCPLYEMLNPDRLALFDYGLLADLLKSKEDCIFMQYTGLKDRNGKEIYEGDICKCWIDLSQDAWEFINEVIYKDGAFGYSDGHNFHSFAEHPDITKPIICDWEVIGNIYENPELIAQ